MSDEEMETIVRESVPALMAALSANERTAAWAERKLNMADGYLSKLARGERKPSLKLAFKINGLIEELKKVSLVAI